MWQPDVTVAAICCVDGKFLMVEERSKSSGEIVINQPAGHLEEGESLITAVEREMREETCCHFTPENLTGLYRLQASNGKTYIRYTFSGLASEPDSALQLDRDIIRPRWMTLAELEAADNLRSALVLSCIYDYLAGHTYPLSILREI